jgi:hypothetical protein
MPTIKRTRGTAVTLLDTALNSLANNTNVLASASSLGTDLGFTKCELELLVSYGSAPGANTSCLVWLLREVDGTNYEDGGASVTPLRVPDAIFSLRVVTGAQRIIVEADLPAGNFRALLRNDATGQAMASSGNTLKIRPVTEAW